MLLTRWPGREKQRKSSVIGSKYMNRFPHGVKQHIIIKSISLLASVKDVFSLVI